MLTQKYTDQAIQSMLIPRADWHPYPTVDHREPWESLQPSVREAYLHQAKSYLGYEWPNLPATLFLQYARIGNRSNYEIPHFNRRAALGYLLMAECIEGEGRFLDDIVNGVWAICEESYWGIPAHVGVQKAGNGLPDVTEPTVDLFAAETGSTLAWTHYLLGEQLDSVSPLVRPRIQHEIARRILTPNLERDDFWWMGFVDMRNGRRVNNWNPWICSNWLAAALLIETDEARRAATVSKILRAVDKFIDPYPQDGGCDEGPSYWGKAGASLFDNLELLHSATTGQIDVYDNPLIQAIGRFIYRVQIDGDYYINFADAPALVKPDPMLVFQYGQRIGDEQMVALGRWLAIEQDIAHPFNKKEGRREVPTTTRRALASLFGLSDLLAESAKAPYPRDVWLDEIEVMIARDMAGSSQGFFVGAKGGHNDESHNHNDIGNFVLYMDGKPVLVDAGVETYTAKTFDQAERYKIWTMQSAYHSLLPTVDGVMQSPGANFKANDVAYEMDEESAQLTIDIAAAYPPESKIESWMRTVTLNRGQNVEIRDTYTLTQAAGNIAMSLITPCDLDCRKPGVILFKEREILAGRLSGEAKLTYNPAQMALSIEKIPITDERLNSSWGSSLIRIVLTAENPRQKDQWHYVLSTA